MSTTSFHTVSDAQPFASTSTSHPGVPPLTSYSISAELFVPDHLAPSRRKGGALKKKSESKLGGLLAPLAGSSSDEKKLREYHAALNISKETSAGGQWRSVTVSTSDYAAGCLLNINFDDSTLFRSIPLHLLKHTDIRAADRSLFFRKHCLGIHHTPDPAPSVGGNTSHPPDALYIDFPNTESLATWISLLRSYAVPELYGRHVAAIALPIRTPGGGGSSTGTPEGGLYRMWRQIDLSVLEGRALGIPVPVQSDTALDEHTTVPSMPLSPTKASFNGGSVSAPISTDGGVYCEVSVDGHLAARTTVAQAATRGGAHEWQAMFTLQDLPPVNTLAIAVYRERRNTKGSPAGGKSAIIGRVLVHVGNSRRGEELEGWWPLLAGADGDQGGVGPVMQVGEIRLKLRIDEEIVLPQSAYKALHESIVSRNFLEWMNDFETTLKLKTVPLRVQLISIACSRNVLVDSVIKEATRELEALPSNSNPNTLFRGNTAFTKTMELLMSKLGAGFLEASIGPIIRRLCTERVEIEVDPLRKHQHMNIADIEKSVQALGSWCNEFWRAMWAARGECPQELRRIFHHIRTLVERRRPAGNTDEEARRESAWQSVSAFVFLRFFVPAILRPHSFGLTPGLPDAAVSRSLTLIGKHIQTLANISTHVERAEFMRPVKNFLNDNLNGMIDYLLDVSTLSPVAPCVTTLDKPNAALALAIRQRAAGLPLLYREAIPMGPLLHDVPKHLAILTSALIQHARGSDVRSTHLSTHSSSRGSARGSAKGSARGMHAAQVLDELLQRCFEIEGRALRCVSRLAAQPHSLRSPSSRRPGSAGSDTSSYGGGSVVPGSPYALSPVSPFAPSFPSSSTSAGESPARPRKLSTRGTIASSARSRKLSRRSSVASDSDESLPRPASKFPPVFEDGDADAPFGSFTPALNAPTFAPRGAWSRSSAPDIFLIPGAPAQGILYPPPNALASRSSWSRSSAPNIFAIPHRPAEDILHPPTAPYASTTALSRIESAESMPSLRRTDSVLTPSVAPSRKSQTPSGKKKRGLLRFFSKGNV